MTDEDDGIDLAAFADRDDPRADLGYDSGPRTRRRPSGAPTRWEFVEVEVRPGDAAVGGVIGGSHVCRSCRESATVLHHDPRTSGPERVLCGTCAGRVLRDRVGWAKASEPTKEKRR